MTVLSTLKLQERVTEVIEQSGRAKQCLIEMSKELDDELNRARERMEESINSARQRYVSDCYNIKQQRDRLQQHLDPNKEKEQSPCS